MFTSVGRRVELLRAVRRACNSLNLDGTIIGLDIDPLAPALREADKPYIVPRLTSPDYVPALLSLCQREQVGLIFPLIDPDIPVLSRHREALERAGVRLAVVSTEAATIVSDKWSTGQLFRNLGVPTPQSWLPSHLEANQCEYPLFIKPRHGSASQQTFRVHNADELRFFSRHVADPIVQECLPGPEITNDVVCDLSGEVLAVVSRRRMEVRWGEVAKGVTIYDPEITQACVKIARGLPAVGPITVQCMMKEGVPYFTEINARLGGGLPLGLAAGADSMKWLLARVAGLEMEIPPLGTYQTGLYLTRYDDSFFVTEAEYAQMAGHRL